MLHKILLQTKTLYELFHYKKGHLCKSKAAPGVVSFLLVPAEKRELYLMRMRINVKISKFKRRSFFNRSFFKRKEVIDLLYSDRDRNSPVFVVFDPSGVCASKQEKDEWSKNEAFLLCMPFAFVESKTSLIFELNWPTGVMSWRNHDATFFSQQSCRGVSLT